MPTRWLVLSCGKEFSLLPLLFASNWNRRRVRSVTGCSMESTLCLELEVRLGTCYLVPHTKARPNATVCSRILHAPISTNARDAPSCLRPHKRTLPGICPDLSCWGTGGLAVAHAGCGGVEQLVKSLGGGRGRSLSSPRGVGRRGSGALGDLA